MINNIEKRNEYIYKAENETKKLEDKVKSLLVFNKGIHTTTAIRFSGNLVEIDVTLSKNKRRLALVFINTKEKTVTLRHYSFEVIETDTGRYLPEEAIKAFVQRIATMCEFELIK